MRASRLAVLLLSISLATSTVTASSPVGDTGIGRIQFPTSAGPEAHALFLRGVAALHSFWYDEAAELFQQAQEVEPDFAMAYWGEALTYNHPLWMQQDLPAAQAVLQRLGATVEERAAKAGSQPERDYLATVEILFGEGEKQARDKAYSAALSRLMSRYPDDLEARALYALSLQGLQRPGKMDHSLQIRSAALLEEVFTENRDHPGLAHYLIHAYDDPVHAPLGLRAARIYADIAPAANHALHMPSHIFVQLGMWPETVASNQDAYDASVAWVERRKHPLDKRDYHSLTWLHYAHQQMGQFTQAAACRDAARPVAQMEGAERATGALSAMQVMKAVEEGSGTVLPLPSETSHAGNRNVHGIATFGTGWSAIQLGKKRQAAEAAKILIAMAEHHQGSYLEQPLSIMANEILGMVALAKGRDKEGLDLLRQAAETEASGGPPSGPPHPPKPALELYGEALLEQGMFDQAKTQFQKALARTPRRTAALLGLARSHAKAGETEAATQLYEDLLQIWSAADPEFAPKKEAESFVGRQAASAR